MHISVYRLIFSKCRNPQRGWIENVVYYLSPDVIWVHFNACATCLLQDIKSVTKALYPHDTNRLSVALFYPSMRQWTLKSGPITRGRCWQGGTKRRSYHGSLHYKEEAVLWKSICQLYAVVYN